MQKLNSLQALRALAAIMVLIGHTISEAEYYFNIQFHLDFIPWTRGVDLFFIISGFIIYYASRDLFGQPDARRIFLIRRFIRVVPLYFLFTSLMVIALLLFPSGVKETHFDIYQIISSYLFIPYERYDGRIAPVLSLGWTINYEMFFYIAFALVITFPKRVAISTITIVFLCLSIAGFIFDFQSAPLNTWTNSLILEFCFGLLIANAYCNYGKAYGIQSFWPSLTGIGIGLILLTIGYWLTENEILALPRFISAGIPAGIIVASAIFLLPETKEKALPRWILALGDSSYSLYLSHRFVLRPATILWLQVFPNSGFYSALYVIIVTVLALVIAYLAYIIVEKPALRLMHAKIQTRKKQT